MALANTNIQQPRTVLSTLTTSGAEPTGGFSALGKLAMSKIANYAKRNSPIIEMLTGTRGRTTEMAEQMQTWGDVQLAGLRGISLPQELTDQANAGLASVQEEMIPMGGVTKATGKLAKVDPKKAKIVGRNGEKASKSLKNSKLATAEEYGVKFETGKPVTFNYIHNRESATGIYGKPKKGAEFGRYHEPSGQFVTSVSGKQPSPTFGDFEEGVLTFKNPLVLDNAGLKWKERLSKDFGGKRGKKLSKAIIDEGYDGVVTTSKGHASEIVNLQSFDEAKALY